MFEEICYSWCCFISYWKRSEYSFEFFGRGSEERIDCVVFCEVYYFCILNELFVVCYVFVVYGCVGCFDGKVFSVCELVEFGNCVFWNVILCYRLFGCFFYVVVDECIKYRGLVGE